MSDLILLALIDSKLYGLTLDIIMVNQVQERRCAERLDEIPEADASLVAHILYVPGA